MKKIIIGLFCLVFSINFIFAIGFHNANEVLSGSFDGNYNFLNGQIGIGTSSPGANLEIKRDSASGWTGHLNAGSTANGLWIDTDNTASSGYLIYATTQNDLNKVFVVRSDGKVGIGTSSPEATLHVNGAVKINRYAPLRFVTTSDDMGVKITGDGGFTSSALVFQGWNFSGNNELTNKNVVFFPNGGNVGIGTTSPGALLTIDKGAAGGNNYLRLQEGVDYWWQMYIHSTSHDLHFYNADGQEPRITTAGVFSGSSDRAYKTQIRDLEKYNLDTVLQLSPKEYEMKSDGKKQIGFIAQDVKELVPELVEGEEGSMSLNYGQISALLTKAIQEQQKKIEMLENRIQELESK